MISFSNKKIGVCVHVGEKVTIRIEECAASGLIWSPPRIQGGGISLLKSRSFKTTDSEPEYRELIFIAQLAGQNSVTCSLQQAGIEYGVKQFLMLVNVLEKNEHLKNDLHILGVERRRGKPP